MTTRTDQLTPLAVIPCPAAPAPGVLMLLRFCHAIAPFRKELLSMMPRSMPLSLDSGDRHRFNGVRRSAPDRNPVAMAELTSNLMDSILKWDFHRSYIVSSFT